MTCSKCGNTGQAGYMPNGDAVDCPCVWTAQETETEGARLEGVALPDTQLDPADLAMLRVREDAETLRRHSTHHSEFVLAAVARAATAQAMLVERMTWAVEAIAAVAREEA